MGAIAFMALVMILQRGENSSESDTPFVQQAVLPNYRKPRRCNADSSSPINCSRILPSESEFILILILLIISGRGPPKTCRLRRSPNALSTNVLPHTSLPKEQFNECLHNSSLHIPPGAPGPLLCITLPPRTMFIV